MQTTLIVVLWMLSVLLSLFIGGFLKSYLGKKGENLATHEDIDKLLDQVKAVTQTTKEIEAKISGELWDRQQQWELKREVAFATAKAMGSVRDALTQMHGIWMTHKQNAEQGKPIRSDKEAEAYSAFNKASEELDQAFILVAIVCGDDLRNKVGVFGIFARDLAIEIADGKPEKFLERGDEFGAKYTEVAKAIRVEMGVKK